MTLIELSPEGNFESWEVKRLNELRSEQFFETLSHRPIYENEEFRLYNITLKPKERLPFRKITNDFSYTFMTDGFGVFHLGDGKIKFGQFKKGDVYYYSIEKEGELIIDFENMSLGDLKFMVFELKSRS
jgi:quercetin dioxygenase-like cupin family protein